jgi:hypothetical protein
MCSPEAHTLLLGLTFLGIWGRKWGRSDRVGAPVGAPCKGPLSLPDRQTQPTDSQPASVGPVSRAVLSLPADVGILTCPFVGGRKKYSNGK